MIYTIHQVSPRYGWIAKHVEGSSASAAFATLVTEDNTRQPNDTLLESDCTYLVAPHDTDWAGQLFKVKRSTLFLFEPVLR